MEQVTEKIAEAMQLAAQTGYVLLATVDTAARPRLTTVEQCTPAGENRVAVQAWIEVPLLEGPDGAGRIALLIWDDLGRGYQLTGQLIHQQEAAVLDGQAEIEQEVRFPQVERSLLMQVTTVEDFRFPVMTRGG
jgi:predicted pyridoxine 5'-phosphate oxidase superfamily flavin-nucleotide-binding protein